MRLVDDYQIPLDRANISCAGTGEVCRCDDDPVCLKGIGHASSLSIPILLHVQDDRWQVELLRQLKRPLLTDGCGADDEDPSPPFCPELAEDQASLDGLPKADLVRKKNALGDWGSEGEEGRLDLVRI